MLRELEEKN